jgi:hypothetical protein
MIRRFNYTGRKRIPRSKISLSLSVTPGNMLAMDAYVDLDGLPLAPSAAIYVEAYRRAYFRRLRCGTVSEPKFPRNRVLDGLDGDALVLFRVKVVDQRGRILAVADKIAAHRTKEEQSGRQSLLPVDFVELGQSIWRLDLEGDLPILQLNKDIENIREIARSSTFFLTLVYPEVVRQVLNRIVVEEDFTDADADSEEEWMTGWLKFAIQILRRKHLPPMGQSEPIKQEKLKWIDDVVNAFCSDNRVLERFIKEQKIGEL